MEKTRIKTVRESVIAEAEMLLAAEEEEKDGLEEAMALACFSSAAAALGPPE